MKTAILMHNKNISELTPLLHLALVKKTKFTKAFYFFQVLGYFIKLFGFEYIY
jgi:hypothetical protein